MSYRLYRRAYILGKAWQSVNIGAPSTPYVLLHIPTIAIPILQVYSR